MTQRNSALVQDSAHAAARMAGQSDALAQAVAHFSTDGSGPPTTALAVPAGRSLLPA